jgi:hypothetical protein
MFQYHRCLDSRVCHLDPPDQQRRVRIEDCQLQLYIPSPHIPTCTPPTFQRTPNVLPHLPSYRMANMALPDRRDIFDRLPYSTATQCLCFQAILSVEDIDQSRGQKISMMKQEHCRRHWKSLQNGSQWNGMGATQERTAFRAALRDPAFRNNEQRLRLWICLRYLTAV